MKFGIFFLSSLRLYIFLYCVFISVSTDSTYIKSFRPKFSAPKLFLYFWMKFENLFCSNTFYSLNNPCRTQCRYTLNQKMNMVVVCPNLYKNNFKTLRDFKTYFFQTFINFFFKHNSSIFCRTNKVIKKHRNIMTLMNKLTHITNLKLISKQSFGELTPLRLDHFLLIMTSI